MRKLKCENNHAFTPRVLRQKIGDVNFYDQNWKLIECPDCQSIKLTSQQTEGVPNIGAWSTMNVTNQKGKS